MAEITPRPKAHMRKFSKWRPIHELIKCNRSSIGPAKPMIGYENRADSQH